MRYNQRVKIGVLPGTFNPPTQAHVALAAAALAHVDRVLFVLPRALPHKDYSGVSFEERLALLQSVAAPEFEVVVTDAGLFIDIARELKQRYDPGAELVFLCGRDAAERIVTWDYGERGAFARMLEEFHMLVASRNGGFEVPVAFADRIRPIALGMECDHISATEIRQRIRNGQPWEHLVPGAIRSRVRELYG